MLYQNLIKDLQYWFHDTVSWLSSSSAMDVQTAIICGGVFIFSALVVYLISVFGMRERTYEEAMEEQRRRNQEAIYHAKSEKLKKEKKYRKWGKRSKEKNDEEKSHRSDGEGKCVDDNDLKGDGDVNSSSSQTVEVKGPSVKKRIRQRKTLFIEKEEDCSQPVSSSEDTDDMPSLSNSPISKQPVEDQVQVTTSDKSTGVKEDMKTEILVSSVEIQTMFKDKSELSDTLKSIRKSPTRKTKKLKSDHLEFASELCDGNENKILNVIKTTSLSEEEIQHILDALGSKQKFNEKRKNEIASLKKIIQEKEDILRTEMKHVQSANDRISELLQEMSDEKAQATATEKSLRDALNQEQQEIKALHGMMQRKREQYGSEMSALQSKMQQMKNKMKEEHVLAIQRLQEENNQLQTMSRLEAEKQQRSNIEMSRLQHEIEQLRSNRDKFETHQAAMQQSQEDLHHQIQQLEKHIEQLMSSHKEEDYSYKQRINEMSNKLQQTENSRSTLVQELQSTQSMCSSMEAENNSLRQRLEDAKHQLKNSEQELLQLQSRLEESNRQQRDLANCLEKMRGEVMDLSNFKHEQLQVIQSLKQENEVLVTQVNQQLKESSSQKQLNGDPSDKSKVIEIQEHEAILKEKENMLHHLLHELDHCKCEILSLSSELEGQKNKNQDLNDRNNELATHLVALENKMKEVIANAEIKVQEAESKVDSSSKEMQDLLNKQIKEVERALQESFSKSLINAQRDAENAKKEADEKLQKSETEANLRLEEFQESLYGRLSELNAEAEEKIKDVVKEKENVEEEFKHLKSSITNFLQRIFPTVKFPESLENDSFSKYELDVNYYLEQLRTDKCPDSKDVENLLKKLDVASEERTNLESQIKIYETVLAETEAILKNLQNNIENEEQRWKLEIHCKEETLKEVLTENEELKTENKTLRTNLEQLQGLREALYEIEELRLKLQKEETEKKVLMEKMGVVQSSGTENTLSNSENNNLEISETNQMPSKSEKRKKSKKKAAAGKK